MCCASSHIFFFWGGRGALVWFQFSTCSHKSSSRMRVLESLYLPFVSFWNVGFDDLRWEDQERIRSALGEGGSASSSVSAPDSTSTKTSSASDPGLTQDTSRATTSKRGSGKRGKRAHSETVDSSDGEHGGTSKEVPEKRPAHAEVDPFFFFLSSILC